MMTGVIWTFSLGEGDRPGEADAVHELHREVCKNEVGHLGFDDFHARFHRHIRLFLVPCGCNSGAKRTHVLVVVDHKRPQFALGNFRSSNCMSAIPTETNTTSFRVTNGELRVRRLRLFG